MRGKADHHSGLELNLKKIPAWRSGLTGNSVYCAQREAVLAVRALDAAAFLQDATKPQ